MARLCTCLRKSTIGLLVFLISVLYTWTESLWYNVDNSFCTISFADSQWSPFIYRESQFPLHPPKMEMKAQLVTKNLYGNLIGVFNCPSDRVGGFCSNWSNPYGLVISGHKVFPQKYVSHLMPYWIHWLAFVCFNYPVSILRSGPVTGHHRMLLQSCGWLLWMKEPNRA